MLPREERVLQQSGAWEEDMDSVRSRFSWFRHDTASTIKKCCGSVWVSLTVQLCRPGIVVAGDASLTAWIDLYPLATSVKIKRLRNSRKARRWRGTNGLAISRVTVGKRCSGMIPNDYLSQGRKKPDTVINWSGVTDSVCLKLHVDSHAWPYGRFTTPMFAGSLC
jgi:hypothetical protein